MVTSRLSSTLSDFLLSASALRVPILASVESTESLHEFLVPGRGKLGSFQVVINMKLPDKVQYNSMCFNYNSLITIFKVQRNNLLSYHLGDAANLKSLVLSSSESVGRLTEGFTPRDMKRSAAAILSKKGM